MHCNISTQYQAGLAKETQALIWNFPICIGNIIKDNSRLLLFLKMWKYPSPSTKEKNYLIWQSIIRNSCPMVRQWDSRQKNDSHCKSVRLGRFGIYREISIYISLCTQTHTNTQTLTHLYIDLQLTTSGFTLWIISFYKNDLGI